MELKDRLQAAIRTRGTLSAIARHSGLDRITIQKIATGKTANPGIRTVQRIEAALAGLTVEAGQ
jgi:DNA-binding phage protein